MALLLLLFVSCVSLSKAYDEYNEVEYGETHRFYIPRRAHVVDFIHQDSYDITVLWKRDEPQTTEGKTWSVTGNYFSIISITHRDSGKYRVLNNRGTTLVTYTIEVVPSTLEFDLKSDERLYFSANVEKTSCNIVFIPPGESTIYLVRRGTQLSSFNRSDCSGLYFTAPCQMANDKTESSCSGRFEVRDDDGHSALVVTVNVQSINPVYFVIGGFILVIILISCCATRCCCGRSSAKKKASQPVLRRYDEYDNEPVGGQPNQLSQPSRTRNPAESSRAATGPLIHDPPTVNLPPAYSSMFTPAQQPDADADPLCSNPEPRFELKGLNFNFASPLGSESTHCNVYTSDKLNFL